MIFSVGTWQVAFHTVIQDSVSFHLQISPSQGSGILCYIVNTQLTDGDRMENQARVFTEQSWMC